MSKPFSRSFSRREFLRSATFVGMSVGLVACTAPQSPGGENSAAAPAAEGGTLTIWGWSGTIEGVQSQAEAFQKAHAGITVDVKTLGYEDTHTNLLNGVVAGTGAPDICAIDVLRLTQYVDGLVDLGDLAKEYKNQFVPPTFDLGSYKGKFYGLATDSEPMGIFYRQDLWEQYSLKEENINTWGDLAEAGNAVADASGGEVNLYHINSNSTGIFEVMAIEQGFAGYFFNEDDSKVIVDDPKMVEAVTALKQLWDSKGVKKDPQGDETTTLLKNSKLATQIVGPAWYPMTFTGQMPELSGKWRLMRAPAVTKGGPRVGYQYPTIFVIPQQSLLKEAAWDLARLSLLGDGARALFEATKVLPAYQPLLDELKGQPDAYFGDQKLYDLWEEIAKDAPPVFFGVGFTEAQAIIGNQLQAILRGEKAVDAGLHDAAEEIRTKLKKG